MEEDACSIHLGEGMHFTAFAFLFGGLHDISSCKILLAVVSEAEPVAGSAGS